MKIVRGEGDKVMILRNKRKGIKIEMRTTGESIRCHSECCFNYLQSSLCTDSAFHLCNYLRENKLVDGDFWFKLR